jgi:hypothetical protein
MHRLASVHLHSFSHYWSRLSVTIATATEQRASFWRLSDSGEKAETTAQTSPIAFNEDEVRGQNFLRDFAATCREMSPLVEFTTKALGQKY